MPHTRQAEAPALTRVTAACVAVAFCCAGVAWAASATTGLWAPDEFRLRAELRDVIPGAIALWMFLIAFQFARGAIVPGELPLGVGQRPRPVPVARFGIHLITATLIGFMGFVLLSMSWTYVDYFVYDAQGQRTGLADPTWKWMQPMQRYSGIALMLVGCLALVRRTRQFLSGRREARRA